MYNKVKKNKRKKNNKHTENEKKLVLIILKRFIFNFVQFRFRLYYFNLRLNLFYFDIFVSTCASIKHIFTI